MLNTIVASRAVLIRNCKNQPVLPDAKPADYLLSNSQNYSSQSVMDLTTPAFYM